MMIIRTDTRPVHAFSVGVKRSDVIKRSRVAIACGRSMRRAFTSLLLRRPRRLRAKEEVHPLPPRPRRQRRLR